ncbi:alpha/beta hydrolase-fold protein [Verrucomicrobia bacterium]|nr:alpha/beta hydrolase-fold protein [Verrucomicrobiota bacterium]
MDSQFFTTEISDPRYESNGLRQITVKSPALKQRGDITVFIPEEAKDATDLPIVILLHGVYGSSWVWAMKGGAHVTTQNLSRAGKIPPMIVAMPSDGLWGDGSGYVAHDTQDFEKWIVEDVPQAVRENIPSATDKSPLFISGLSMGGFGALRIGAKHGDVFRAATGLSSVTELKQIDELSQDDWSKVLYSRDDETVLDTILAHQENLPALRFDCGSEDFLIEPNRKLHQALSEAGIKHIYEEYPGEHTWPYWEEHLADSLMFFGEQL